MKKSLEPAKPIEMPEEFARFFDLPTMVGGEKHHIYFDFFSAIADAVKPIDIFDWIWVNDFVEAEWGVRRDRRIKVDIIKLMEREHIAERACEASFANFRRERLIAEARAKAEAENPGELKRQDTEKEALPEVEKIEVTKIEDPYVLANVFMKSGNQIDLIDRRISAGEKKRDGILREIYRRRESLARRLEKASSDIIDAEFTEAEE